MGLTVLGFRRGIGRRKSVKLPALKVIDAATDPQWKLLIALGRFGGLRIPSEALALSWGDVDFGAKRFTVRSRFHPEKWRWQPLPAWSAQGLGANDA